MSDVKFIEGLGAEGTAKAADDKAPKNKVLTFFIEGAIVLLACVLGLVIRLGVYETAIVTSNSMLPTLQRNDRLLVDHRSSLHGRWKRGDIVIFEPPESWSQEETNDSYIKRVIGLPGETVQVLYGVVKINDRPLIEKYRKDVANPADSTLPITLKPGEYWVMGDNRDNSFDSREGGPLAGNSIHGRAIYCLGPFGRSGKLSASTP